MPTWTKEQQLAIDKEGSNIIVSAGAGSGKTAVLSERVLRKLKQGVNINELLILTFTNAAAEEMKNRIRNKIKNNKSLNIQLDYIDQAYITTFDSYALSIVRKYNYILNIPKNITPIESTIINTKKKELIEEIFEKLYTKKDKRFLKLINDFCVKNDNEIKESIIKISNSLDKKYQKKGYLDEYINKNYADEIISKNVTEFINNLLEKTQEIQGYLYELEAYTNEQYYQKLYDQLTPILNVKNYKDLKQVLKIEKLAPVSRETEKEGKQIKSKISELIKELKKEIIYETEEEIKEGILETKDNVEVIIDIIKQLDTMINDFKQQNNLYEFNDIAKMAIKVVKENEYIREEIKRMYNEILVDEYQDTSDLQEEFLNLIENNNLYMVGDIKQSIYRFRNANPNIFKEKYEKYQDITNGYKIDLVKNFRSRKEVLENINEIFNLIMDKDLGGANYQKQHQMKFGNSIYEEQSANQNYNMEILNYEESKEYSKEEIEAFIIANDIKEKIKNKYKILENDKLKPVEYKDFCIIMDRGTSFETYKKIFEYMKIPLTINQDEVLTNQQDILVIKNIIGLIIKISEKEFDKEMKYYFTSISRSFLLQQTDQEIFEIIKNNNYKETDLYQKCYAISKKLNIISIKELLDEILKQFNVYEKIITIGNIQASQIRIENILSLAETLSNIGFTPKEFKEYLNEIINNKEEIKYSLNVEANNNVKLMNIHKSKGLEFSICYFSGIYKEFNKQDIKDRFLYDHEYGIITPYFKEGINETILKKLTIKKYLEEDISERLRLLYVDFTRVKEKMIIVAPLNGNKELQNNILDIKIRKKYKSFLDILNSIEANLKKYIKTIDIENLKITNDYKYQNNKQKLNIENDIKIKEVKINIENDIIETQKASKTVKKLLTKEEKQDMKYGTKIHELFELTDFNAEKIPKEVKKFLQKIDINQAKIYKEHEFIYEEDNEEYHGIIDLILEYDDKIKIIDYKLQNIKDENYVKQLNVYKQYLKKITSKDIELYLYSILNNELQQIK